MRWETEQSFDYKLCQEYFYEKLFKSDNWFSVENVRDVFLQTQCTNALTFLLAYLLAYLYIILLSCDDGCS